MINRLRAAIISIGALLAFNATASAVTISPGGSISATAGSTSISVNGITLTCASSTIAGSISAAGSGSITSATYSTCRQVSLGSFTITATPPWTITTSLSNGVLRITQSQVIKRVRSAIGCTFLVSGSSTITVSGAALPVDVTVLSQTGAGSNLVVSNSSGCLGLVNNGNAVQLIGNWALAVPWRAS